MQITIPLGGTAPAVKLSPAMLKVYKTALLFGYVDRHAPTSTVAALIRRGVLREADPMNDMRHYPATTPEQVWDEAHTENEQFELGPRFPEGTPEYAAYAAELRTELGKWAAGEAPYDRHPGQWTDRLSNEGRQIVRDAAHTEAVQDREQAWMRAHLEHNARGVAAALPAGMLPDDDLRGAFGPVPAPDALRCPSCGSRQPNLHPAVGGGGEVTGLCPDSFHGTQQDSAPAPTLADDVATLRRLVNTYMLHTRPPGADACELALSTLDRIAGAVPQRATDPESGAYLYQHDCGHIDGHGAVPAYCHGCSTRGVGTWQALYTLGGAA